MNQNDIDKYWKEENKKLSQELKDRILENNPNAMLVDGFDDCLSGFDARGRAIYWADAIIDALAERDNLTPEQARVYYTKNIEHCPHNPHHAQRPIFMYKSLTPSELKAYNKVFVNQILSRTSEEV